MFLSLSHPLPIKKLGILTLVFYAYLLSIVTLSLFSSFFCLSFGFDFFVNTLKILQSAKTILLQFFIAYRFMIAFPKIVKPAIIAETTDAITISKA